MGIGAHSHMDADVAARHSSGLSAVPSAAQPCVSKRDGPPALREPRMIQTRAEHNLDAHGSCKEAGPVGWGERVTCDELIQFPATRPARGEPTSRASGWAGCFGREGTPDICPGRPRGAGRGPGRHTRPAAPSPHHRNSARISWMVLENGGFLIRESPGGGSSLNLLSTKSQHQFQFEY